MKQTATITLSQENANALIQLLDLATKSGGLNVAQATAAFYAMLNEAFKDDPVKDNPYEEELDLVVEKVSKKK